MSSTYSSPSTVDAHAHSHSSHDDLVLNNNHSHLPQAPFEQHLSPFYPHPTSNQTTPYHNGSTPGESISEHSNYQPSEFSELDDPFFGVDFSAGPEVYRTDSLPFGTTDYTALHPSEISPRQQEAPQAGPRSASDLLSISTYPISPRHTSIANTPSPRSDINDLKTKTTLSHHELVHDLHDSRSPGYSSLVPAHSIIQLTPNHSGSSHTSAESAGNGTMAFPDMSPHHTMSQWENEQVQNQSHSFVQPGEPYNSVDQSGTHGAQFAVPPVPQASRAYAAEEEPVRAGVDMQNRTDVEVPSLKQQEEEERLDATVSEVERWRSQAKSSKSKDERSEESRANIDEPPPYPKDSEEVVNDIPEMNETYIRDNRLQDNQAYYNMRDESGFKVKANEDFLSRRPLQFHDPPRLPYVTLTHHQPGSSEDAIRQYNVQAETLSIRSRVATWGSTMHRRKSESSMRDYRDVEVVGNFFGKLSIKPKEGDFRQSNYIEEQLGKINRGIGSMIRKTSDAKLKRARSSQNISDDAHNASQSRHNSQGSLAPPPARNPSFGRGRPTPSLNTAFGAMTGSLTAVGSSTHTRKGSVGGHPTSPQSPPQLGFPRNMLTRVRSKSDITSQDKVNSTALGGLLRAQGGPPVARLATSPPPETAVMPAQSKPKAKPPPSKMQDEDDEDDDDEEQEDDSDMKVESAQQTEPIIPNYEGFKAHVRRLNPDMEKRYNWLVSRIAHQQEIRYKHLLELRVKHSQAVMTGDCAAKRHCEHLGGRATLLDAKGNPRESGNALGLQPVTDLSDDSNPGEGALTDETFPQGVPMPPTKNLPAEFECQLCYKAKKFQKPSDWTKHVHEDVQPFTCTYERCKEPKSFKRKADWVRHENERHRHLEWWVCQVDDCTHPCYRKDNFLQHLVREHKLPEPKQKTKAAIKKARDVEPAWVRLEQCHHETRDKPQDEPCKFCGKSFNTWKKLTVHLAKHMEHISLPILYLVESKVIDGDTIISPVREHILTPITPTSQTKLEFSHSPYAMDDIAQYPMAPHISPSFDQPGFNQTTGPSTPYGMQAPIPQNITYGHSPNFYQHNFGAQQMDHAQGFGSINHSGYSGVNHNGRFGSLDSAFPQPKIEQARSLFGSVDAGFTNGLQNQNNYLHQTAGFSIPQNYASAAPVASGFQALNIGISHDGYDFNSIAANVTQQQQQQQPYPHVPPVNRTQGSASPFGHSPQNQNMNHYGQH